jgi:hypothetical protein
MRDDIVTWLRQDFPGDSMVAQAIDEIERLRAELAAERVLCESYLIDKNQITQAWADELDRVKELQAKLAALSARHERALIQGDKLREALEPFANIGNDYPYVPTHEDYERARAVLKEKGSGDE